MMTQSVIICSCFASIEAQTNVALCDVGLIFKNHPEFTQSLAALKQEAIGSYLSESDSAAVIQKAEVKQYEPGSIVIKSKTRLAQESAAIEVELAMRCES